MVPIDYDRYVKYLTNSDASSRYDSDLTADQKKSIRTLASQYSTFNGALYRIANSKHRSSRRVIRESEVVEAVGRFHSNRPGSIDHGPHDATIKAIEKELYDPNLRRHVVEFINACPACQLTSTAPPRQSEPPCPVRGNGRPWNCTAVDILQLPETERGNRDIQGYAGRSYLGPYTLIEIGEDEQCQSVVERGQCAQLIDIRSSWETIETGNN
ncbi:hypothetical protein BJ085DRAFT_27622 [Dimargaris cristalligena]|uniref:Integrase zinc-binding domain-containing protein n=1 Tax=Dimargaris cristalligena TaxID=215637 RepID=A0A4P9ZT70_9FUNG|nr:hypothetical protein BJ085DRAFT_27622 [Dimargaris cristalligena]|eukprot:RKP36398.1 hypothetical protein BJ085DRAFT_27622 [Dimargaris cristalligena]